MTTSDYIFLNENQFKKLRWQMAVRAGIGDKDKHWTEDDLGSCTQVLNIHGYLFLYDPDFSQHEGLEAP